VRSGDGKSSLTEFEFVPLNYFQIAFYFQANFKEASGQDITSFKRLTQFHSRDQQSIQVSVVSSDGVIKVCLSYKCLLYLLKVSSVICIF